MRIRPRWSICLVAVAAGLSGCGGSTHPSTQTGGPASTASTTSTGPTGPGGRVTVAAVGSCAAPVVEFADEHRIGASERAALEGLLTALVRFPPGMRCASGKVKITAPRPAGTPKGIRADYTCLTAATYIEALLPPPATIARPGGLAAPPVQAAARLAMAAINANEHHGATFCTD